VTLENVLNILHNVLQCEKKTTLQINSDFLNHPHCHALHCTTDKKMMKLS